MLKMTPLANIFNAMKEPVKKHNNSKWGAFLLMLAVGFGGWQIGLPELASFFNNRAFENYKANRFADTQQAYELALWVDPKSRTALYNLGWLCEEVQDLECAREKYLQAAKLGLPAAYSNLARLYIVDKKNYPAAVHFLWQGLKLAEDDRVKYSLLKNLGWARLEQGRYSEALQHLDEAIKIDSEGPATYCLKAQVLEKIKNTKEALPQWKICLKYADSQEFDEDIWIGMARQRLNEEKTKK
ncbi:tetratricopeptide repeat protein [Microcoleus sp. AT8-B4]|uniref:tetratricopeptide repeat protein n=2 Tax=Microcoleus TaxID=44471 RepID=UPI002FD3686E